MKNVHKIFLVFISCLLVTFSRPVSAAEKCGTAMDVAFLVDSSGSLGISNYRRLLDSINVMATYFNISPMGTHGAVVLYSNVAKRRIGFDDFLRLSQFKAIVSRSPFMAQQTRIDLALQTAADKVFTAKGNVRDYLPKIAILVTDGRHMERRNQIPLTTLAANLRRKGVTIYVIGVSNGVSQEQLKSLVTSTNHLLLLRNFYALTDQSKAIAKNICERLAVKAMEDCKHPMDLGFILHSPEGIRGRKFLRLKQFISGIATTLGVEGNKSRAGLILYSNSAVVPVKFNQFENLEAFNSKLYKLSNQPGKNRMDLALREANINLFSSAASRASASRIAIVLTVGKQNKGSAGSISSKGIAAELRERGIKVMVVAVGRDLDIAGLEKVAGQPSHVTQVKTIRELRNSVESVALKICEESVPTARRFTTVADSYSTISAKWTAPYDPEKLITKYEVTWRMVENDKGENIINSPLQTSGDLPPDTETYTIKDLDPYSLYEVSLNPKYRDGVKGDIPASQTRTLENINECLRSPCDRNAECTNTNPSFTCKCNTGYTGDGFTCVDDDECSRSPCDTNGICTNSRGSYKCKCEEGFSGDGFTCTDDDECAASRCDTNAECINTPGSFTCKCTTGYSGDGVTCADIDECLGDPCDANAKCTNAAGSFTCQCNTGYSGDGFTCVDVNECEAEDNPCDVNAECYNKDGSYYCECNVGYNGNGHVCHVVNICSYPMDLAIAIDTSDSISKENFEMQQSSVIMLARSFGLSKLGTRVAVIVYGSDANLEIKLGEYETIDEFTKAVRKIKYRGGNTRIDLALDVASSVVFTPQNGARGGMPKMLILMTDGQQTSAPDAKSLKMAVSPLLSSDVKVVSIAIGTEVDEYELMAISETRDNIYPIKSFDNLFETVTKVGAFLCQKAKKDCKTHADIALLVDSSASMRGGNYLKEKALVKAIAREFDVSRYGCHVGLVLYNDEAKVMTSFKRKMTLQGFEKLVDDLPLKGGKIRLDKALRLVASEVFTKEKGMRDGDVPKILFVLTDGTQNRMCDEEALELAIAPLRSEGIHVVAIGVGEAEERELRPLVKSRSDLFIGTDFDEVTESVTRFIKGLCKNNDRSCTLGSQFVDIRVDSCISEKPVEIAVCDGKCPSGTRYITKAPFYEGRCTCCFPSGVTSKVVSLSCQDGTMKPHRITEAHACQCSSCAE